MVKKGFFFWIEFILLLLVAILVILNLPSVKSSWLGQRHHQAIASSGYEGLKTLDSIGIFSKYIDEQNISNSNFSALSFYIKQNFPNFICNISYWDGNASCYSENGTAISSCDIYPNLGSAKIRYVVARTSKPIIIWLYLKEVF